MIKDKLYIGIDLGGTFIKGGVVSNKGQLLYSTQIETQAEKGPDKVTENIIKLINNLIKNFSSNKEDFCGVGIGVPGIVNSEKGIAVCSHNLKFDNFPIAEKIEREVSMPVKIANDANLAALGESLFGFSNGCKNVVMLTLGTGVGGGAIINGTMLEGNKSAGAEFGHSVIVFNGNKCNCGRKGCLESYVSATALIKKTKEEMLKNKSSKMWQVGSVENVNGKTAFNFKDIDKTAKKIVEEYINYLSCGVINIVNVFRPEVVVLGGGISNQGESLFKPLQKIVDKEMFASKHTPKVKIVAAKLGNNAGVLGSVGLFEN
ncbi:MAG: ROK family protein [Clostridia bacterium]|nr:ROK family protein [Clostridia bacterium]